MSFSQFDFKPQIQAGIKACGYLEPTPIQREAIPPVLAGRDLLGLAQTGTGKTAAFVLPILQRLQRGERGRVRALIVAPTRELAEQINDSIMGLAGRTGIKSATIYGGVGKVGQLKKIREGIEIIVACPGRLLDHLESRSFQLGKVEVLVLDEADMMFDMGFMPAIRRLLKYIPGRRQNLLFSATMPKEIRSLANEILKEPITVQIDHEKPVATVSQTLYPVEKNRRMALLMGLMNRGDMETTLIFTRTKYAAKKLAAVLEKSGYRATSLQGNLSQSRRQQALDGFKQGRYNVLVATDIAARGIDVAGISHVVNYDVPGTVEAYTHRIGRTGRADQTGEALTFAGLEDRRMIRDIERSLGIKLIRKDLPDEVVAGGMASRPRPPRQSPRPQNQRKKARRKPSKLKASTDLKGGKTEGKKPEAAESAGQKKKNRRRRRTFPLGLGFLDKNRSVQ